MAAAFAPPLRFTRIIRAHKLTHAATSAGEQRAARWNRAPRRLFLGLGASYLMAAPPPGNGSGSQPFTASARPQVSPVDQVLKDVEWPEKFPFKDEDFARFDESPDTVFYSEPRSVTHIDDPAIAAITKYYSKVFPPSNTPGGGTTRYV